MNYPAIVVAGYNRPNSIKRLLKSLSQAKYPKSNINLVISLDRGKDDSVFEIARDFIWEFGEKKIIHHGENLGLRNHILKCGDLTEDYGSIVLLEDDLYVSPYFYEYTLKGLDFYQNPKIAGIALYSHRHNETARMQFVPLGDDSDVFFMQIPCSWGQAWTKDQWRDFRNWYEENNNPIDPSENLPSDVLRWHETSWKKYFYKYVIEKDKYFVYPRESLTTNFMDAGTHQRAMETRLQVPLQIFEKNYKFKNFDETFSIYDGWCEILPKIPCALNPNLCKFSFEVDLYGTKDLSKISKEFVLTSKSCVNSISSYSLSLKPHEMNILKNIEGNDLFLVKKKYCNPFQNVYTIFRYSFYHNFGLNMENEKWYIFGKLKKTEKILFLFKEILNKIKNILKKYNLISKTRLRRESKVEP